MLGVFQKLNQGETIFLAMVFAYIMTCFTLSKLSRYLPKDAGRDFALNGKMSRGKPRGSGSIFITVFALTSILFLNLSIEIFLYIVAVFLSMLTGFFDDASEKPWGEYLKGILDLVISIMITLIFIYYNTTEVTIRLMQINITLNKYIFCILAIILIWGSINVTNCSDGVDGLVGTVSIISLLSFFLMDKSSSLFKVVILIMIMCILGYMWFNVSPSKLIMGDAGSRAIGVFIAITALKSQSPLLFLVFAIVLVIDGGSGLVKIFLLRVFKIRILKNTCTPLHDHVRKAMDWSDTQTVIRFVIIQVLISLVILWFVNYRSLVI